MSSRRSPGCRTSRRPPQAARLVPAPQDTRDWPYARGRVVERRARSSGAVLAIDALLRVVLTAVRADLGVWRGVSAPSRRRGVSIRVSRRREHGDGERDPDHEGVTRDTPQVTRVTRTRAAP